jgi:hypothetical protein
MDTARLNTYAPKTRRDFITAVDPRAAKSGITTKGVSPVREEGQLIIIEGQPYPNRSGGIYGGISGV